MPASFLIGLGYICHCQAGRFPVIPPLFLVRTSTKFATCWSLIWPWENNLQMHRSVQSIVRISKQPVAPKTHILRLSPSNQLLGFCHPRLSWRVWKTTYLVKRWMSCNCWCSSSCNLLICPFRLVEKNPLKQSWISLQECWLEFHWSGVTSSLENPGSQVSYWRVTSPGARWSSRVLIWLQKGESGSLDQYGPVGAFLK